MIKTDNDELRLDTHQLIMQSKWNKQVIKLKCLKFRQKKAKKSLSPMVDAASSASTLLE